MKHLTKIKLIPFVQLSKTGKKHYLSANLLYAGIHFIVRKKIVEIIKQNLTAVIDWDARFNLHTQYKLTITIIKKSKKYDIDNIGYFWAKMYLDTIKAVLIPDDNVSVIPELHFKHQDAASKDDEYIIFEITEL